MSAVTWVFDSAYPRQLQLQSDKKQDILFFSKHKTRQSLNSNFVGKVIGREKKGMAVVADGFVVSGHPKHLHTYIQVDNLEQQCLCEVKSCDIY